MMKARANLPSLAWAAAAVFLALFFFYPLARILWLGLRPESLSDAALLRNLLGVLWFTFYQAALSTLLTALVGLPLAYLFARYQFTGKPIFRAITAIPFMLPTVVVAAGFNALLGPRGWLNLAWMGLTGAENPPITFVGTLGAILVAHIFYNATIVIRMVGNAWASLDTRLADAARSLGASPWQVLWRVTLPLLRPSIFSASLLVFLFDFSSFGVILMLGGPRFATLEVEIYIQALQMLNLPAASLLSLAQLACTLGFSVLYSRALAHSAAPLKPRSAWTSASRPRRVGQRLFVGGMLALVLGFFALPLFALPLRSAIKLEAARGERTVIAPALTADYYTELFVNRRGSLFYVPPVKAAFNSLRYAGLTVFLSLLMGFPAAWAFSRPGRLAKLLDPLLMLPLGASAVTLGLGYIVSFNKPPLALLSSPWLVPLAHTTIALPFVIRSLQAALATIPVRYREAASVLGANPWQVWAAVDLPILARALVTAAAFAFTVSLGEFGVASLLARPDYPTLPTAIYRFLSQPGGLNYGQAMAMATLLMGFTGLAILLIEGLRLPGSGEF